MPSTPSSTGGGGSTNNNPLAPRAQEMQTRDNPFADSVSYQYPPDDAPTASVVPIPTTVAPPASHAIPVAHTLGVSGGASSAPPSSSSSNPYPGRGGGRGGHGEEGFLHQSQPPLQQPPPPTRQWASPSLDWLRDGESCWWSLWCPLLLFTRTTSRFELHPQPCTFASMVIGMEEGKEGGKGKRETRGHYAKWRESVLISIVCLTLPSPLSPPSTRPFPQAPR